MSRELLNTGEAGLSLDEEEELCLLTSGDGLRVRSTLSLVEENTGLLSPGDVEGKLCLLSPGDGVGVRVRRNVSSQYKDPGSPLQLGVVNPVISGMSSLFRVDALFLPCRPPRLDFLVELLDCIVELGPCEELLVELGPPRLDCFVELGPGEELNK